MSTPILPFAVWAPGTNQNSIPANDNSLRQQILNGLVISDSTTAQPGSPADGDIYIIPAAATGAQWSTFDEFDLTIFDSGTWYAFAPVDGVVVNLAGSLVSWDGATYVAVSGGGSGDVVGPASSTTGRVATFADGTGKLLADGGVLLTALAPKASPTFTGTVAGITATMVGLGSVTNDAQTKAAIVPNTAPSSGQMLVGNAGGTAYAPVSASGDATLASTGALTIANDAVTNAKMANVSTQTIKGRTTASSGDPEDLTAAQAAAVVQGDGLTVDLAGFRGIPQNSQSTAYTLVAADAGKHIFHPSADTTARIWTIPANSGGGSVAFPIGTTVTFINQNAGGVISIAITTDTMRLAGAGTTGTRALAANGIATAVKVTSTEWIISGTGLT